MDKGGQLLIVLLIIKLFEIITQHKKDTKIEHNTFNSFIRILYKYKNLFLTYLILSFSIVLINEKFLKISKTLFLQNLFCHLF